MKAGEIKRIIDSGLAGMNTSARDVESIMEHIRRADSVSQRPSEKRFGEGIRAGFDAGRFRSLRYLILSWWI